MFKLVLSGVIIIPTKENISSLGTLEPGVIKTIRDTSKTLGNRISIHNSELWFEIKKTVRNFLN